MVYFSTVERKSYIFDNKIMFNEVVFIEASVNANLFNLLEL